MPLPYDADLCRQRPRIEIMFDRLEGWHRIAIRYDRCAHAFFVAMLLAATVTFRPNPRDLSVALIRPLRQRQQSTSAIRQIRKLSRSAPMTSSVSESSAKTTEGVYR
jgi:hypothetical protein